jgi:glyoxylase-like metal-dependent hydrolase (beta-lactamase superfamily II)
MNRKIVARVSAGLLFLLLAFVAYTQNQNQAPKLTVNKIKDDLFEIEGDGGNVGVYVTSEGVILIDDKYDQDHDAILEGVKRVTPQPVKYVISTHSHADHSGGNAKMLGSGVEIISTANSRRNIVEKRQAGAPPVTPARIVFTDETSVFLGGKEVRAHHYGRGHTDGDAIIYFPALRVVHTGDLFTNAAPFIDYNSGGSVVEWSKTLDNLLKSGWDFDTVIPGHGPVSKKEDILKYKSNVEATRNKVSSLVRDGKSKDDISKTLVSDFGWNPNGGSMLQIDAMLAELKR